MTTKGFKVFDSDWKCRGFQYEVGKFYKYEGIMKLCGSGFHYCNKLIDCFGYYKFNPNNKVAEIEAIGEVERGDDKSVTNGIKIVREITWNEVLEMVNTGRENSGYENSGNWNSGNRNSGNSNSGNGNSGHKNSGYWNSGWGNSGHDNSGSWNSGNGNSGHKNSGCWNSGNRNSANGNSGNRNSGSRNSGNWNSGMFNACNYANGLFNSKSPNIYMFNKLTELTYEEFTEKYFEAYKLLTYSNFNLTEWVPENRMTDEEKVIHLNYRTTGGYLKQNDYKIAFQEMWENFSEIQKNEIKKLPNFDKEVFFEITGIKV